MKEELDFFSKQLLLIDPSVQRAYDRLDTCALPTPLTDYQLRLVLDNLRRMSERAMSPNDDTSFMWSELFSMSGPAGVSPPKTLFSLAMAVVTFNQGLLLHSGQVCGTRRRLERALSFYNMAIRWYFDLSDPVILASQVFSSSLGCAILNNAAYILYQLGDFTSSRALFFRLNNLLMDLGPPSTAAERCRREELTMNVLLFYASPRTAPTA